MSMIPTPSGITRPQSRLPTSGIKPPGPIASAAKRPRPGSAEMEDAVEAKRAKESLQRSKTSLSMMHLPTSKTAAAAASSTVRQPIGARTGTINKTSATLANRIAGNQRLGSGPTSRPAMGDRTNVNRGTSSTASTPTPSNGVFKAPPKRQGWDLKGRLEDMEAAYAMTMQRVATLENQNIILKTDVEQKETVVAINTEDLEAARAEVRRLKRELEVKEDEDRQSKRHIEDLVFGKSTLERRLQETVDELSSKQSELATLKTTVAEMSAAAAGTESRLKVAEMELERARSKISELEKLAQEQKDAIDMYQEKQRSYETERRRLHNTILELKGNIRVFCRVRPFIGSELDKYIGIAEPKHIVCVDKSLEVIKTTESPAGSTAANKVERHQFEFDHVFGQDATQEDVFEEISQLVQSAIDGYNVCIFAYGQTGSGKTFTMEGGDIDEHQGIIPRTIAKIYEDTSNLTEKGWSYKMQASFLEIYNEEIRDLLATEKGLKYDIKKVDTKSNEIYVSNLKVEDVTTGDTIKSLLNRAKKNRIVAATNCNERSSRSHSVFMLKISGTNSITSEACTGTLNLVDLAGSERLKESGSTGLRLEETKNINSSLSNLSKVIMALASNKDGFIPYRDSKLTHLLMNSLGGNSKTLMFVNLSPREDYVNETLNSLRFAKRVNQCQIGTATKKVHADIK